MPVSEMEIYRSMMLEIKIRFQAIDKVFDAKEAVILLASLDSELVFLQIRKIIELIAFSAVVCDKNRYAEFRKIEADASNRDHGKYERDWNAGKILKKLKNISPHFLPIPISKPTKIGENRYHFDTDTNVVVTHSRLIEIYKSCGGLMHVPNPFGQDCLEHVETHRHKYQSSAAEAKRFVGYLKSLIWCHTAIGLEWHEGATPTENANPNSAWIIDFGSSEDRNISIVEGVATSSQPSTAANRR
jgi:hypothetical protein